MVPRVRGDGRRDARHRELTSSSRLPSPERPRSSGPHGPVDVRSALRKLTVAQASRASRRSPEHPLPLPRATKNASFAFWSSKVEPALARLPAPRFLVDYPISQASLARAKPDDPRVCERFELYLGGIELCNGFGELTDPIEQRRRLLPINGAQSRRAKPVYPIDERFVASLEEGMPPSAGNALGLDPLGCPLPRRTRDRGVIAFPEGTFNEVDEALAPRRSCLSCSQVAKS